MVFKLESNQTLKSLSEKGYYCPEALLYINHN